MIGNEQPYPELQLSMFRDWSPSIHYAQEQTLAPGKLAQRRIYDFELLYVVQGEAVTYMPDRQYRITAGQLIFLPAGVLHQNEVVSSPYAKFIGIHFDFFDELDIVTEADIVVNEDAVQRDKFAKEAVTEANLPLSSNPVYTPPISCVKLMEQLVEEFTMRAPGYELLCKSLMLNILAVLYRTQLASRLTSASVHGSRITELMSAIEQSPAHPWTNKALGDAMDMTEDHFAKLFKRHAGMPPGEFIGFIRHREARRLLRETEQTIEEVGRNVGYADIHYFSRSFSRHEGISPRAYRKLARIL
ncbi:AraC family transcriptional regulator [Paenibacillus sp. HB172176]|uniref:AraC family transcriptional regulator n=1 Tax=Paenibacillus sp. HB172176 TaxID=2493690 RepID=UPI00143B1733|nr:AraC family transcriptional regulator [Paenibacillus sp. HB172176]